MRLGGPITSALLLSVHARVVNRSDRASASDAARNPILAGALGGLMRMLVLLVVTFAIAACSTTSSTIVSQSAATASSSRAPTPSRPPSVPAGSGFSDPKQAALDGALKQSGATYLDGNVDVLTACPAAASKCLAIESQVDGSHAVYFRARLGSSKVAAACFIYVFQDAGGWHFLDMVCAGPESGVAWPDVGEIDYVFVAAGSCANIRATPGLGGRIVGCLRTGTTVRIDAGPDYVAESQSSTSHIWWHIEGNGWIAHDFLVPTYP